MISVVFLFLNILIVTSLLPCLAMENNLNRFYMRNLRLMSLVTPKAPQPFNIIIDSSDNVMTATIQPLNTNNKNWNTFFEEHKKQLKNPCCQWPFEYIRHVKKIISENPEWQTFLENKDRAVQAINFMYINSKTHRTKILFALEFDNLGIQLWIKEHVQFSATAYNTLADSLSNLKYASQRELELTDKILAAGIKPNSSIFIKAIQTNNKDIFNLCLKYKVNIEKKYNKKNNTPLMLTACKNRIEMLNKLIKHGAHINAQNNLGETALHVSICNENVQTVMALLQAGADESITTIKGKTCLQYATDKTVGTHNKEMLNKIISLLEAFAKRKELQLKRLMNYSHINFVPFQLSMLLAMQRH